MQLEQLEIGIIEDDPIMGDSLAQRLELEGHRIDWWRTGSDAINSPAMLDKQIIICDIRLPDITGEAVFRLAGKRGIAIPFIFITGFGDIDQAVRLMRRGACDYITKPFDLDLLIEKVSQHAERQKRTGDHIPILGISEVMKALEIELRKYAKSSLPLVLSGEVGVGKEKAARFLHANMSTGSAPFMHFSCRLVPSELHEQELFGEKDDYKEFPGGYVSRTRNGTLYIEDIELLSPESQSRLLSMLDAKSFPRESERHSNLFEGRVIAASRIPMNELQSNPQLDDNLFFQLGVLKSDIPPLRSRSEDIPWLLFNILAELNSLGDSTCSKISAQAEEVAISYDWPGNILEMRNRVQRALALAGTDELTVTDLFPDQAHSQSDQFPSLAQVREDAERRQIRRALVRSEGHMIEAAKLLGVSRTTLWDKMGRLGIASE